MKELGFALIVLSIPACLFTSGLDALFRNSEFRNLIPLSCLFTITSFLAGVVLVKYSNFLEEQRRNKEAQIVQEEQARKVIEKQKKEEEIIKKWINKQPKQ